MKEIPGYNGDYKINESGVVINKNGHVMRTAVNNSGYLRTTLEVPNTNPVRRKNESIHRLVAETFIPNPDNKPCIDHINTNRADNRVENLRWVTYSENSYNPITNKRNSIANTGASNPNARKTKCITTGKIFETTTAASKYYNVQRENICRCCKGVVKSAGKLPDGTKLEWEYID